MRRECRIASAALYARARNYYFLAHGTSGAARIRHSLRPLITEGGNYLQTSGASRRENAKLHLPSLRAQRSNPSRRAKKEWIASSQRLLAMTASRSRRAFRASFAGNFPPSPKSEGAGNAGCALHPRSRAQCVEECAHEHTGQRRQSDIPCAMALRLITCSPRRTAPLPP